MSVRPSTWVLISVVVLSTAVAIFPTLFLPAAWFVTRRHTDYDFTNADVIRLGLLGILVIEIVVILFYAAIRSAFSPAFRRDGLLLTVVVIGDAFLWFAAALLGVR